MPVRARLLPTTTGAVLLATVLAACGGSDEPTGAPQPPPAAPAAPEDVPGEGSATDGADDSSSDDGDGGATDGADGATSMPSGAAAVLTQTPDVELTEVEQDRSTVISAFDQEISVPQAGTVDTLPVDVAEQILAEDPSDETEFGDAEEVAAAEGETFVVAIVQVDDPRWEPVDDEIESYEATENVVRVEGSEVDLDLELTPGEQVTVVLSVPDDAAPEDVVLESVAFDVSQEISLLDGTRTASGVEEIYARPTDVEVGEGAEWSHDYETRYGGMTQTGQLTGGVLTPFVPEVGWANPGHVFLGVDVTTQEPPSPHYDESTIRLRLADGSTVEPETNTNGSDGPFTRRVWFQLPVDAAEAVVEVSIVIGLGGEMHDIAVAEVPLTMVGGASGEGEPGSESAS
ncbi:hypothetical protein ACPYO6_00990 [Georgenia sp. Z1344]|uniref:hypothetical protein n=1 Tax=Georgenia sp. Z1344 TaxID=3416706 RepID=UPI003CF9EFA4